MIHNLNNFVNESLGSSFVLLARISPKENSGANGKFPPTPPSPLPTPKFRKESAEVLAKLFFGERICQNFVRIVPPPARILGGQNPKKKNVLSIFRKNRVRANQKSKEHFFFLGLPSEARQWRNDTSVRFSFKPPRAPRVRHHLF